MTNGRWLTTTLLLLCAALCVALGGVLVAVSVATAPNFPQVVASPYSQVQGYAFDLNHADCDIVIFGDSSAMTADDPATIEAQTHQKTCNISQTRPIVTATGTDAVDLYLRRNKLPRYLVIQLSPDAVYQVHGFAKVQVFEPMTFLLRYKPGAETARTLLRYPLRTLRYARLVLVYRYLSSPKEMQEFEKVYRKPIEEFYQSRGRMTLPKAPATQCMAPRELEGPADFGWIDEARRKYSAEGIRVLVLLSPIPDCDPQRSIYQAELTPHVDDGLTLLPISLFNDIDRHFTLEGATVVSKMVSRDILAAESSKSPVDPKR